jgi:exonuclease I
MINKPNMNMPILADKDKIRSEEIQKVKVNKHMLKTVRSLVKPKAMNLRGRWSLLFCHTGFLFSIRTQTTKSVSKIGKPKINRGIIRASLFSKVA